MVGGVSYASPKFSRTQYNQAGSILAANNLPKDDPNRIQAVEIVGDWRMSHVYPLEVTKEILTQQLPSIYSTVIVSQRIKRIESVEQKLRDMKGTRLTQIQDIGGCRAVIYGGTTENVGKVVSLLEREHSSSGDQVAHRNTVDHIRSPKPDGYRSVHVILAYEGPKAEYKGLKTEIQIRTKTQHMWATSFEICEFFSGRKMRVKHKAADKIWQRFFALTSSYLASQEGMPLVPGTPTGQRELIAEIREIDKTISALDAFRIWRGVDKDAIQDSPNSYYFILDLDTNDKVLTVIPFDREQLQGAEDYYLGLERDFGDDPTRQIVLVSVDNLASLAEAYPNYFRDASAFCSAIGWAVG